MEIIGLISAVIGLLTAIVKRKKIIELKYSCEVNVSGGGSASTGRITIGKRFKRLVILLAVYFVLAMILAAGKAGEGVFVPITFVFFVLAFYQLMAMVILIFVSMWR